MKNKKQSDLDKLETNQDKLLSHIVVLYIVDILLILILIMKG